MERATYGNSLSEEYNWSEILAKTFLIPARDNQFKQRNEFEKFYVVELPLQQIQSLHQLGFVTGDPFWCQEFDLKRSILEKHTCRLQIRRMFVACTILQ